MNRYQPLAILGEGSFGKVYMARDLTTGNVVAVKQIKADPDEDGMPVYSVREISILKILQHENVVQLLDVVRDGDVYLVFEHMDSDLHAFIQHRGGLKPVLVKQLLRKILLVRAPS